MHLRQVGNQMVDSRQRFEQQICKNLGKPNAENSDDKENYTERSSDEYHRPRMAREKWHWLKTLFAIGDIHRKRKEILSILIRIWPAVLGSDEYVSGVVASLRAGPQ